jgi:NAD+ kinase
MIGVVAHSTKVGAAEAVRFAVRALRARKAPFAMEEETARLAGLQGGLTVDALASRCTILIVLGGDGTILRLVHRLGANLRPIFGVNIGSLGFLTCAGPDEIPQAVASLVKGNYLLSQRTLLAADLSHSDGKKRRLHALNDVVISRGERSELVKIEVAIDGELLTEYHADGLIVATPTGSTAYSLSAGGPVLMPESGCFVVTPICPHVLTNRSTVVSEKSVVTVRHQDPGNPVFVTADGQGSHALGPGDVLEIRRSRRTLPLAMLPGRLFPEVLRQKLKWSGSNV